MLFVFLLFSATFEKLSSQRLAPSHSSFSSSSLSGLFTCSDVLPCVSVKSAPLRISVGTCANAPKPSSMPAAVSTLPSITPVGGTRKPPIKSAIATNRVIVNKIVDFIVLLICFKVTIDYSVVRIFQSVSAIVR